MFLKPALLPEGERVFRIIDFVDNIVHREDERTSLPEQTNLTRTRIQCFTGVVTAVGTIEAQVALTELGVYALAVSRTVVQCCADGLTAVSTSESSETSIVRKVQQQRLTSESKREKSKHWIPRHN